MACPELLDEYWSRQQQDLRKLPRSVLKPKKSPRSPWLSDPMTEPTEVRPDEGFEVREIVSTSSDEDEITVAAARKLKSPAKKRQTRHHTPLKPTAVSPAQNGSTARKKSTRYVTSSESSSEEELVDELPDLHDDLVERVITVQIINVTNDGIPRHYVIIELVNGKRTQCQLETAREHFPKVPHRASFNRISYSIRNWWTFLLPTYSTRNHPRSHPTSPRRIASSKNLQPGNQPRNASNLDYPSSCSCLCTFCVYPIYCCL